MVQRITSGSPWEDIVGYCRAVKVGDIIEVAGTTSMDGEKVIGEGNVYEQAMFIFSKIEKVLMQLDAGLHDVVRSAVWRELVQKPQPLLTV